MHDSLGRPMDPAFMGAALDRRPELDPRQSMKSVALNNQFAVFKLNEQAAVSSPGVPRTKTDAPPRLGTRCAAGLVDCMHTKLHTRHTLTDGNARPRPSTTLGTVDAEAAAVLGAARPRSSEPIPLRLMSGPQDRQGRLEILFNGSWGTVCDQGWTWGATHVSCRQLGYVSSDGFSTEAAFGMGTGPVWMSHVECDGKESSIGDCEFYGLNISTVPRTCDHSRDVGISCSNMPMNEPQQHGSRVGARVNRREGKLSTKDAPELGAALDELEAAIAGLEVTRLLIDHAQLVRLSRLRLRLNRLAGKPVESCQPAESAPPDGMATAVPPAENTGMSSRNDQRATGSVSDAELGISAGMASRLPADLLAELRKKPRNLKSLAESRKEFEEQRELERFDPLANDPVEQVLRNKAQNYVPEALRPPPLTGRKPHEILVKPPIQTLVNRKPPHWADARRQHLEYTKKQIKLGLAPEGILRTFEPGPWDHDPVFWGPGPRELEGTLASEITDESNFDPG